MLATVPATATTARTSAAAVRPARRTDRNDASGPLDLQRASLTQEGPDLVLFVVTRGRWGSRQLGVRGRSLCLEVRRPARTARICVEGSRLFLESRTSARPIPARFRRPSARALVVRFPASAAGLAPGAFGWDLRSSWSGRGCAPRGSHALCPDRLPDSGTVRARLAPFRPAGCRPRPPDFRTSGPGHRRLVALTFDDGPGPYTPPVLEILAREHVHATFFLIGRQIAGSEALVRRELDEGNVVGNHTWDHANVSGDGTFAAGEIESTTRAIQRASGYRSCLFRAPGGAVSGALVAEAFHQGMNTIQWNVDPRDWARPGEDAIVSTVLRQVRRESIVIMHDGGGPREQTVAALPRVIAALRRRGYRLVTVPQLLGLRTVYG